jgi:hypothetical protein
VVVVEQEVLIVLLLDLVDQVEEEDIVEEQDLELQDKEIMENLLVEQQAVEVQGKLEELMEEAMEEMVYKIVIETEQMYTMAEVVAVLDQVVFPILED